MLKLGIAALAGAAISFLVVLALSGDDDSGSASMDTPPIRPAEYLYLDNARVAAYLSQEQNGTVPTLKRSLKKTAELSAGIKGGGVAEVAGKSQVERFVEETVTPTAASAFAALLGELKANGHLRTFDATDSSRFPQLKEGMIVRIWTDGLLQPSYSEPYGVVKEAATLRALFPRSQPTRRAAKRFVRSVGPNPRLTFALETRRLRGKGYIRYLLPIQYGGLSDERSLFTGRHKILAKVVRVFANSGPGVPGLQTNTNSQLRQEPAPLFVDAATRETWTLPLRKVPEQLLAHLQRCRGAPKQALRCLKRKLLSQTSVFAPGAVLVPIAIYK